MIAVFCKQGELKILFLQFKKSGISNRKKKKKKNNFAITSTTKKKIYVIWWLSQILNLISINSMRDSTISRTDNDQMDNVRISLNCVFPWESGSLSCIIIKGTFNSLFYTFLVFTFVTLYFIKPKTHLNARKLRQRDFIYHWLCRG